MRSGRTGRRGPRSRLLIIRLAVVAVFFVAGPACGQATYTWSHFAGPLGGRGSADGPGSAARFHAPRGVAVDSTGNVYVADTNNNAIRKISPAGVVTTIAGLAGNIGSVDGTGSAARFSSPGGVAVDFSGNVYVADGYNRTIRRITAAGVVTTLAGLAGSAGSSDGMGSTARFSYPAGIAVDSAGNVYVADQSNHTIRKVTPAGVVTTLAGLAGSAGSADGTGSTARFYDPAGIAVDSYGIVHVADTFNHTIRRITSAGVVTTLAGSPGSFGSADGTGPAARFYYPAGIAVDSLTGIVYVADGLNHTLRKVTLGGAVTTLAGFAGSSGSVDGTGSTARFSSPVGIAADSAYNVYVADSGGHSVRKVNLGVVTTLAGLAAPSGSADGTGTAARFSSPAGVAFDSAGNLYITDASNSTIRRINPDGVVTTLAGLAGSYGSADGTGSAARFSSPAGVAIDSAGSICVADSYNDTIRKVTVAGVVTTLAGLAGVSGSANGTGPAARFYYPDGIAVDSAGSIYVADSGNHTIRKVTPAGVVTTFAGLPGSPGSADGTGSAARFNFPSGVVVDGTGHIYVADSWNGTIRRITPAGVVTTLAGLAGSPNGSVDGTGSAARFNLPTGVAVDSGGNVYVTDSGGGEVFNENSTIRKVSPAGVVTTIGGLAGTMGGLDGAGSSSRFDGPAGLAVDATGSVYVADRHNNAIRIGRTSTLPTITSFAATPATIALGQASTLGWASTGGTSASIDAGVGSVATSGSHQVAPTQTTTYTLTVTGLGGAVSATATVTVQPAAPGLVLTSINPASGPTAGGTAVTITGTGFQSGATVRLGGVTATNTAFVSGTTLTAVTPPHGAGPVDVDVVNPDNQSARLAKGFSYQDSPATLTIQSVTPNFGPRTGGTSVTIKGTAFQAPATVYFGTSSYPATFVTVVNSTTITAKTPVHGAGNVDVTVSCGGSNAKLASGFRYTDVTTHIDSVDAPVGKAGDQVTISGVGFTPGILVKFNGASAGDVSVQSSTTIKCKVPAGSGRAIPVTVAGSDNNGYFTYVGGGASNASLTAVIPSSGQLNGGSSVTITGAGFQAGASVYFGANQATSVNIVDSTKITATVPALPAARMALALATGEPQTASVVVVNPDSSAAGGSSAFTYAPPGGGCVTSGLTQCLSGNRFTVQVAWKNPYDGGSIGVGHPIQLTSDTGSFWFFSDQNTELMVKVLDGSTVNGYFWVFYGALSDVEYTVTVTDTATGVAKSYHNPARNLGSVADTRAFFVGNRPAEAEVDTDAGPSIAPQLLERTEARLRAEATERAETIAALATTCLPNDLAHCLSGGRFRVSATWRNPYDGGTTGVGHAIQLTADTGYFWFFADSNVELVVKVLDGTSTNGRYWVFYGALSDVEYTITVTDTLTGAVKTYYNPPQHLGSVADTAAF